MTLLASERSLLIRNKFRSVLQLRIQNRRLQEINRDAGLKSSCLPQIGEKDPGETQRLSDNDGRQKLPSGGVSIETAQERAVCGGQRQRKVHQSQDPADRIRSPPAGQQQESTISLESCPASLPANVFEDDISPSSSFAEQCGAQQSPAIPSLPGLPCDQSLSDCSATTQPPSRNCTSSLPSSLNLNHLSRPRKPRDTKPKMKKLKYHQYIPPDQRRGAGTGVGGAKQKSPNSIQSLDPAYSHLLKQPQVFLHLQILQNQQQLTVVPNGEHNDLMKSSGALPQNVQPVPGTTNHSPTDINPVSKPELLPSNLVDLTVSELRQQLRKRGLPVSGTKPTLLQRLCPFQLQHACLSPAPFSQLSSSLDPLTPSPPLPSNQSPGSSSSSGLDSPSCSPNQQLYIQDGAIPNGIHTVAPNTVPNGTLNTVPNAFTNAATVSLAGEQCNLTSTAFMASASTASGTPSPSLPMSSSSLVQCGTHWRADNEQQEQQQQELSVELQMRERIRSRPRDRSLNTGNEPCEGSLHPFLQQDPGCSRKTEAHVQSEPLLNQVFCCQPCDLIDRNFELPVQITASPVQTVPGIRSLEEDLQEAIQRAQMDPPQSIDDILDEAFTCDGSVNVSDRKSPAHLSPDLSASPQREQSQSSQQHNMDSNFLPSPLCSSFLFELPPSPAVINPNQVLPAPPPLLICTSPLTSTAKSRKRRAPMPFDAADWLETLTSGLRPVTPPKAPFVEPDSSLDSDLNVNRVLDLLIEKW
uniref:SAP domain-containing protein n=1 Tax=Oryzias latipes TaxID=8090 RepID=A0A3P9KDH1_ORYLA